ncbi:MAG: Fe-S cluster assembly protein SufD [Methylophaga sp.]|nr:MAG: Fe-S cluster assembly protein SufD [Methylophaga sp.]
MPKSKRLTELATPFASVVVELEQETSFVKELRGNALAQFNSYGLPAKKEEDWKYTSLWGFSQQQFSHQAIPHTVSQAQTEQLALLKQAYRVVIVDGVFSNELSQIDNLPTGLTVSSLAEGLASVQSHLGGQINIEKAGFNALNTMLMNDGVVITVAKGINIEQPIELLVINSGATENLATHLRNVIVLEENSQVTVIEHYVGLSDIQYLTNVVTEVVLAKSAELTHYKLQQESENAFHIATLAASQAAHSQWKTNSISLGAKLARNDVHTQLLGEQAHVVMDGLYLLNNKQHSDFHTRIDHAVPNTTSEELFKGVIDDKGHGVFNGKVIVHKDAQKTDSNQQNHNLLLSRNCEIDSKPELEIYADDVKCAHGSTVGQMNEDHLFFLRTRGLDEVSARNLLTYAFAVEVLERIPAGDIRKALSAVVEQRLPQGGQ